jgi:tRNA nucleotidyltransferase (CCA-adding enzyme)
MFKELSHKTFLVGGACRNMIMGKSPKDLDYCVEDTSEEELLAVFPDAKKVGEDFPVYLINGHEVALCRTEKSVGDAYGDFEFVAGKGISIFDDLARRDLTINSIAINYATKEVVDPHNGTADIQARLIRTINPVAFEEDAVRIYRAIRFAMEFGFDIEPATLELMKAAAPKLASVTLERVELELSKTYERCERPSEFFVYLNLIDGLKYHFEEFEAATHILAGKPEYHPEGSVFNHLMEAFDRAKKYEYSYEIGIAALLHDISKIATPAEILPSHIGHEMRMEVIEGFFKRHRFSLDVKKLAKVVARQHMRVHDLEKIKKPAKLIRFVKAINQHLREDFIKACNCDAKLSLRQSTIFRNARRAVEETHINPEDIKGKSTEAIIQFVEKQYVDVYKNNS